MIPLRKKTYKVLGQTHEGLDLCMNCFGCGIDPADDTRCDCLDGRRLKNIKKISNERFIRAWQKAETIDGFIRTLRISPMRAVTRAVYLRDSLQVPLKTLPRETTTYEGKLRMLAESSLPKEPKPKEKPKDETPAEAQQTEAARAPEV